MIQETQRETEKKEASDIRQSNTEDLPLLVTTTESDPKQITVARWVVLKTKCETSVLVSTQAAGLIEVVIHESAAKIHAYMAKRKLWTCTQDVHYTLPSPISIGLKYTYRSTRRRMKSQIRQ